jgi:hypothetical protein
MLQRSDLAVMTVKYRQMAVLELKLLWPIGGNRALQWKFYIFLRFFSSRKRLSRRDLFRTEH